jgi:RNA polymerase sigma-70 factor (ECF subfamily)
MEHLSPAARCGDLSLISGVVELSTDRESFILRGRDGADDLWELMKSSASELAIKQFYALVWPYRSDVLRTARMLTRHHAEADDLAQETLLKAFAAIDSFREGTDMRAWLMRILRNVRIDKLRSKTREAANVSLDAAEIDPPAGEEPGAVDDEEAWHEPQRVLEAFSDHQIIAALRDLPEEIRFTLLLVDVQQLDHADAASILEVPVGTIKSRAHRGRAMLRARLLPHARELKAIKEST